MKHRTIIIPILIGLGVSTMVYVKAGYLSLRTPQQNRSTHKQQHKETSKMPLSKQGYGLTYGKDTALRHVINFFDIGCTHCATFFQQTWPIVKRSFVDTGQIRFTFMPYPIHAETLLFMTCTENLTPVELQILFEILMESDLSKVSAKEVIKHCVEAFHKSMIPPSSKTLQKALYLTQKHEFTALPMIFFDGKQLSDDDQYHIVNFLQESLK